MKRLLLIVVLCLSVVGLAWSQPQLVVQLIPMTQPIVPSVGGSILFHATVINHGPTQSPFWIWARLLDPYGHYTSPTLGPLQINPPVGVTLSRNRMATIPGSWPTGTSYYLGYANWTYSYPIVDSAYFTFLKLGDASADPWIGEASCTGEPFPGEIMADAPVTFRQVGASPNPFNPTTTISYELQAASYVSLKVFDVSGKLVATLVDGHREPGSHQVTFNGSKLASGMYLYTLTASGHTAIGKMMLIK